MDLTLYVENDPRYAAELKRRNAQARGAFAAVSPRGRMECMATMEGKFRKLLEELAAALGKLYASRLRGLYVYGSYVRGDWDSESDFDVLIVLDDFSSYGAEVERTAALASALSLQYGISVSQVFLREHEWLAGDSPFVLNVRDEAVAV